MADLRALVEELGVDDVRTYVQSGNVVFRSTRAAADLEARIARAIEDSLGLEIPVVIRSARQLRTLVDGNPFAGQKVDPSTLHVTFLASKPARDRMKRLEQQDLGSDRFELVRGDVCLSCPGGYGRTKLSNAMLERHLAVPATTRNWRTVTALAELAAASG